MSSDDDTDSTEESDREYDSERDSDVDLHMEDDVDAPDSIDLDGDVDMERDGDDEEEDDEAEEDEKEEEEQDEDNDEDEDDGKEPRTIGQREMVNTSADDVDTMVDNQPTVRPAQGQEMREHTPRPQHPAPALRAPTPEPGPWPGTPVTHPLSGLEFWWLVTLQKPRPAAPTLREAETAGNTMDVNVHQQLLGELAGADSLPNVPLPEARPDVLVGEK